MIAAEDLPALPDVPRVALIGEFSAGKSTILNALFGRSLLPVAVTATRLPPVWITYADRAADLAVRADGEMTPLEALDLGAGDLERHMALRLERPDGLLRHFDVIDTPGISDPHLEDDRLALPLALADLIIWCTPANQAWRQSEVAAWRRVTPEVRARSLLLVTRIDTLGSDRDRSRVLGRLREEAGASFSHILTVDGRRAAELRGSSGDARANFAWRESGAAELVSWLKSAVTDLEGSGEDLEAQRADRYAGLLVELRPKTSPFDPNDAPVGVDVKDADTTSEEGMQHRSVASLADYRTSVATEKDTQDVQTFATIRAVKDRVQNAIAQQVRTRAMTTQMQNPEGTTTMTNMSKVSSTDISALSGMAGFIGGCLVDSETGLMMAAEGGANFDLEAAAAGNTEVVKAKHAAKAALGLDDHIEDILITLGTQFHLIRPLSNNPEVFLYVALDKKAANLGMARVQLKNVEKTVAL